MSNTLFKDLTAGSPIHALVKGDNELKYEEGAIVSVGAQRMEMPQMQQPQFPLPSSKMVVDVTYSILGKNYTDAVDVSAYMFPTDKTGAITLIATDKEPIIRELNVTLKKSEDYLKNVETEIPRNKKRVSDCKALISQLDTKYAEKQELENRIKKLEDGNAETHSLLKQLIAKIKV